MAADNEPATLPSELLIIVFTDAARTSTQFAATLCLVARWTRALALPHLYSTIVLNDLDQQQQYNETLKRSFDLEDPSYQFSPREHLRHLWASPGSNRILEIFRSSHNISNLALAALNLVWLINSSSPSTATYTPFLPAHDIDRMPNFRIFVLDNTNLSMVIPGPQIGISLLLNKITHLQLANDDDPSHLDYVCRHLPNLTHLAIPYRQDVSIEWTLTSPEFQKLMRARSITHFAIIVYTDTRRPPDEQEVLGVLCTHKQIHPKLYWITCEKQHLQRDWECEARGGQSFWDRVEEFTESTLAF